MDPDASITPGWTESLVPPPPAVEHSIALARPVLLRPLWIGLFFALSDMLFALVAYVFVSDQFLHPLGMLLASLFGIAGIVYYFMSIHRLIRVMRTQPGWLCRYTPGSVVVQQFVPLLGIVGLYRWTGDVERYTNGRLVASGKWGSVASWVSWRGSCWLTFCRFSGLDTSSSQARSDSSTSQFDGY